MFKKLMAILLCLVMVFSLAGCGEKEDKPDNTDSTPVVDSEKNPSSDDVDEVKRDETPFVPSDEFAFEMKYQFTKKSIYKENGIEIVVDSLTWDKTQGLTLGIKATDSESNALNVSTDAVVPLYINGNAMRLSDSEPSTDGITYFNISPKVLSFFDIEDVYNLNGYAFYAYGESTSDKKTEPVDFELTFNGKAPDFINRGMLIHDRDGIKMYFVEGQFGIKDEISPVFYMVNESEEDAYFTITDIRLNDGEAKPSNCVSYTKPGQRSAWSLSYDVAMDQSLDYDNLDVVLNIHIYHGEREEINIDNFSLEWIYGSIWND